MAEDKILLEVQNLKKYFPVKGTRAPACRRWKTCPSSSGRVRP